VFQNDAFHHFYSYYFQNKTTSTLPANKHVDLFWCFADRVS